MISYFSSIQILPIIVATIVSMGLGFLWYSPLLFAKPWIKLMGYTPKTLRAAKYNMKGTYALSTMSSLVTATVLSFLINFSLIANMLEGLLLGLLLWLGFEVTVLLTDVLYGKKKWALFAINAGYQLVSILFMAGILTYWV